MQGLLVLLMSTGILEHAAGATAAASLSGNPQVDSQTAPLQTKEAAVISAAEIAERYPSGAIDSVTAADMALREVKRQRALIDTQHVKQEEACMPNFFTNNCLDHARESRRKALAILRPIEIEANAFKRRARVEERDRELAAKQPKSPDQNQNDAGSALRKARTEQQELPGASGNASPASAEGGDARAIKPARERALKSTGPDAAAQRRSMAVYDKKLADSLKRQKAVAARKTEAEQKRLKKQAAAQPVPESAPSTAPAEAAKP